MSATPKRPQDMTPDERRLFVEEKLREARAQPANKALRQAMEQARRPSRFDNILLR